MASPPGAKAARLDKESPYGAATGGWISRGMLSHFLAVMGGVISALFSPSDYPSYTRSSCRTAP